MKGTEIKLGYAPTRRSIFSAPDAIKYRGLTKDRLLELGVSFVDIDDINPEGLLYDDKDVEPILEKFRKATQRQPLYQCVFHEDDGSLTESYGLMFE